VYRCEIDVESTKQSDRYNSLDTYAKTIVESISAHNNSLLKALQSESIQVGEREERTLQQLSSIETTQIDTHIEVTTALKVVDFNSRAEHEATRRELEQMKHAMLQIEQDMVRRDEELKGLLLALSQAQGGKERERLQEKSNAVTAALYALVTIYQSLQVTDLV